MTRGKKIVYTIGAIIALAALANFKQITQPDSKVAATAGECTIDTSKSEVPRATVIEAVQGMCDSGMFSEINFSNDKTNQVVMLRLSPRGFSTLNSNRANVQKFMTFMKQGTDALALSHPNVALTLFDTDGDMVAGCVHERGRTKCRS